MRHKVKSSKLGRSTSHQKALVASLVCNLIKQRRIKTTLPKAKIARTLAEKMVTLGRRGTLAARRRVISVLGHAEQAEVLFTEIVPRMSGRAGGYTRILKLGRRTSDSSEMVVLEWVEPLVADAAAEQ
jgi:large subunit ribosomal protein L17